MRIRWYSQAIHCAVLCALALFFAIPPPALAWGKAGHRVVATLAMSLLSPEARTQVADLLGPNVTLAAIATWADEVRSSRPNTGPWHYVNIPWDVTSYDAVRDRARGCVVSAIEQYLRLLQDRSKDRAAREETLRWVVHFVADLHHPSTWSARRAAGAMFSSSSWVARRTSTSSGTGT